MTVLATEGSHPGTDGAELPGRSCELMDDRGSRAAVFDRKVAESLLASNSPGLAKADEHYFHAVYDDMIRISDLIDSYRDLLAGASTP